MESIDIINHGTAVIAIAIDSNGFLAIVDKNGKGDIWNLLLMKKQGESQYFEPPVQKFSFDKENEGVLIVIDGNGIKHSWNIYSQQPQNKLWPLMILPLLILLAFGLWFLQDIRKASNQDSSIPSLEQKLRLLILVYPRSYRQDVGNDMIWVIICQYKNAYKTGGALEFLNEFIVSLWSIAVNASREHLAEVWEQLSTRISD